MNKVAMLAIFAGMNILFLFIDFILAGIFFLLWPVWFKNNLKSINDEL